jgi:quinol monooxygenase YgiN
MRSGRFEARCEPECYYARAFIKSLKTRSKRHKERHAMSKLVIMGTIEVAPGKRDQVTAVLMAHRARCLKDEPGTLQFDVALPRDDDTRILIHEVYRNDDAFEVHRNGPSIARYREETGGMIINVIATRCTPVE